ncbi:MAG TPA: [FeFe] hydrogenase H-cluster radical SAM maturase HydG [Armatimonadota bacterium]|jgi:2-iminoacetate synthase
MKLSQHASDFIDDDYLTSLLDRVPDEEEVRDVTAKSLAKEPLTVEETAVLINANAPGQVESLFDTAHELKRSVYGNRIVLFAPLYVGNLCINDCQYCGFRRSNSESVRRTLEQAEIAAQVRALEDTGQKRLILVFGEHPRYDPEFIAECVRTVYATKSGKGEIRRANINAAPLDHEGYKTVKTAGIGTYQVFQETYHKETYAAVHPAGTRKSNYMWRLDSLSRAMEAGIDDVGIGALFGLHDWRFDVLALVAHARFLKENYGVGPHTISFPRLQPASGVQLDQSALVSDADFKRLVAILRLAVPYTGMILTCRESEEIRREVLAFGVSQIDAGTRLELGGYTEKPPTGQEVKKEQFQLGDMRSLDDVTRELMVDGYIPSFCTACYRLGRTGEVFMEYAIPGFIQRMCTPNAMTTLMEYLTDYASPQTREVGERVIASEVDRMPEGPRKAEVLSRLEQIRTSDARDLIF